MPLESFGNYRNEERMAPAFSLPNGTGRVVNLWDFKQRKAVVLYFLKESDTSFLEALEKNYCQIYQSGAQLLVVINLDISGTEALSKNLQLSFPLLADPHSAVLTRYIKLIYEDNESQELKQNPDALFIADRFGSIYRYATAVNPEELPDFSEIFAFLEFLGNLCNP